MMDTTDIAAAAMKANGRGRCNCHKRSKDAKPSNHCPKCGGSGTLAACLRCGASGWNATAQAACQFCEGRGYHLPTKETNP